MTLTILALCIFIFGAYAYGSLLLLSLRHRQTVWAAASAPEAVRVRAELQGLAMFVVCTLWFALHAIIEFRGLMGDPPRDDWWDLAVLPLVFVFPGLIFQTVLLETRSHRSQPRPTDRVWSAASAFLYAAGAALAIYVPLVAIGLAPRPQLFGAFVNLAVGGLFSICSAFCIAVMVTSPRPSSTRDQQRLRQSMLFLFVTMIVVFFVLTFTRERALLMRALEILVRAIPLAFLVVSVYFENRIEFYDLIIKRGVILLISLLLMGTVLTLTLGWLDRLPPGATRAWIYAVVLLPVAMVMSWLHDWVGRLLDRLWFGRDFTPVEAVKHVLAAMQQATDEVSLVVATETTLSEMFRTRIMIVLEDQPVPDTATVSTEIRTSPAADPIRIAIINDSSSRALLSEDHALLRSLASVFGFMLENVRLHRRRGEQEQVAQELRLQTSRSELKALRAQINPHFLFNALNAIASLIHTDPARADAAVEQLAEVFRYTLRRSDQEWAPLDQELAFARAYLDVEQARFGRRLEFSIDADAALGRAQVPSMLLQTLVENAVKHGISRLRAPGRIEVRAWSTDGRLALEVRDTGPGIEPSNRYPPSSGESFGLRSVRDRLRGHFGAQASLDLSRDEAAAQTVARISMPLVAEDVAAVRR
jgi:signal transduction histidine kinase